MHQNSERHSPRHVIGIALSVVLALALAGCGGAADDTTSTTQASGSTTTAGSSGDALVLNGETIADAETWAAAQEEGGLTLYSAYSTSKEKFIHAAFEEQVGLTIEMVRLPTVELLERMDSERSAGIYEADVIHVGDEVDILGLADDGVVVAYSPPFSSDLPSDHVYLDGTYYAWIQSPYGIAYNTGVVDAADAPDSWLSLLDEKWTGRLGIASIGAGGSHRNFYQFVREEIAPDYWQRLAALNPTIYGGVGPTIDGLTRGEVAVAPVILSNLAPVMAEGASVDFVIPEEGLSLWPNYMGMVDQAPHPNSGKVFMSWLLSLAGQEVITQLGEYPIREGTSPPEIEGRQLPPLGGDVPFWTANREDTLNNADAWEAEWYEVMDYTP